MKKDPGSIRRCEVFVAKCHDKRISRVRCCRAGVETCLLGQSHAVSTLRLLGVVPSALAGWVEVGRWDPLAQAGDVMLCEGAPCVEQHLRDELVEVGLHT